MARKYVNGQYLDMTTEDIAAVQDDIEIQNQEPSIEKRIAEMEAALASLAESMKMDG